MEGSRDIDVFSVLPPYVQGWRHGNNATRIRRKNRPWRVVARIHRKYRRAVADFVLGDEFGQPGRGRGRIDPVQTDVELRRMRLTVVHAMGDGYDVDEFDIERAQHLINSVCGMPRVIAAGQP